MSLQHAIRVLVAIIRLSYCVLNAFLCWCALLVTRDKKQPNLPEIGSHRAKMLLEKADDSSSARLPNEGIENCLPIGQAPTGQAPTGQCCRMQFHCFSQLYTASIVVLF